MEISEKERLLSVVGGIMCADSKTPTAGNRSPKEAIMANAASGKVRTPAVEITRSDALSEILAESWWLVGLRGILGIIFGLICLLNPTLAVQVFVILFAAYMLVDGVFAISSGIKAARNGERWGPANC